MNVAKSILIHDFIFFLPFCFREQTLVQNFFELIIEGIGTLCLFELGLSQNYRDVTVSRNHSVSILLI